MFLWPLARFWTYTPLGFICAVVWNICEMLKRPAPAAPWMFSKIIQAPYRRTK